MYALKIYVVFFCDLPETENETAIILIQSIKQEYKHGPLYRRAIKNKLKLSPYLFHNTDSIKVCLMNNHKPMTESHGSDFDQSKQL